MNAALHRDGLRIADHALRNLPLATASLSEEYRYQSLPLCVIDSVFSISIRYAIVRNVVARYCAYTRQPRFRADDRLPPRGDQESIGCFCERPEQTNFDEMAKSVYGSRHLTSPKNGILKAEAAYRFAVCLRSFGVEHFQDVAKVSDSAQFERDIRNIPGQRSGLSLNYFWMLTGSDDLIKPDRMVLRFLSSALDRTVAVHEAQGLLKSACELLVDRFPKLTLRLLDHEIWKYQSARQ